MFFQKLKLLASIKAKNKLIFALIALPLTLPISVSATDPDMAQAIKLMSGKQWQQAETTLRKLQKHNPNDIAIHNNLAITAFHLNKPAEARKHFIKALESNPHTKVAFRNLLQLNSVQQTKRKPYFKTLKGISKSASSELPKMPVTMTKPIPQTVKSNKVYKAKPSQVKSKAITKASKEEFKTAAKKLQKRPAMTIDDLGKEDDLVARIAAEQPPNSLLSEINQEIDMEINFDNTAESDNLAASDDSYLDDLFSEDTIILDESAPELLNTSPVEKELENSITQRLQEWSNTWSAGDVDSYFKFYAADYSPDKQSRKTWMKTRRARITPQREIKVTISDISVTQGNNPDTISTRFLQKYRAKSYRDIGYKTILWAKQNGTWVIVKEKTS